MRTKTPAQSEKILNVAVRLFATHRFHEARMEDIAAAAGVGKGTLYRYFKDKEELYLALLARAAAQISTLLDECLHSPQGAREKLELFVGAILGYFDENPHAFDLIQHAEALHNPDRPFAWQETRSLSFDLVRKIFAEGEKTGAFHIADPEVALMLLLGGLRSMIRFGEKPRPPDLARRIVDVFLNGAARSEPRPATAKNGHAKRRTATIR